MRVSDPELKYVWNHAAGGWAVFGLKGHKMETLRTFTVGILMPLAIAGRVSAKRPVQQVQLTTLSATQVSSLQARVKDRLKDPDSARFGDIAAGKAADDSIHVCGLVNSKNSFGGYTGMAPYTAKIGTLGTVADIQGPTGGDGLISSLLLDSCREEGLSLSAPAMTA